jgi:hypothetical protein
MNSNQAGDSSGRNVPSVPLDRNRHRQYPEALMHAFISVVMILYIAWLTYSQAKHAGEWSWPKFFLLLGVVAVFIVVFIFPVSSSKTLNARPRVLVTVLLSGIIAFVVAITYFFRKRPHPAPQGSASPKTLVLVFAMAMFALGAVRIQAQGQAEHQGQDRADGFSIKAPEGWHVEKRQGGSGEIISRGHSSVTVSIDSTEDGSTPPAKEVLDDLEKQYLHGCPKAQVVTRGNVDLGGAPGLFFEVRCADPEHPDTTITVAAATVNGKVVLCQTSADTGEYSSVGPVLYGIVMSFRLEGGIAGMQVAGGSSPSPRGQGNTNSGNAQKLRALEHACSTGALTPDECAAKRAQLTGAGSNAGPGDYDTASRTRSNGQNSSRQPDYSNAPPENNNGTVYNDPQGAFSLMISPGWTVKTKSGCYGPPKNCPPNIAGVNIMQGRSWAFVAPYSGKAHQPSDVVRGLAEQYQSEYENFQMIATEPSNYNGLDLVTSTFTGIDQDGSTVALLAVGVAAPNGQYYVVSTSVPRSEVETLGAELRKMLTTIRFAGQ